MDNSGCPGNGWSVITSAPTNSQLAGVLAGFIFTGIIILLGRPGMKNTQTLGLFSATFVVLAFDSYMFSLISGGGPDPLCVRVWTESMPASGMLATGGVALLGGIAWLLDEARDMSVGAGNGEFPRRGTAVNLAMLSRFMFHGVMTAVTLLLTATTIDYLDVVFDHHKPDWVGWAVLVCPIMVAAIVLTFTRRHASYQREASQEAATRMLARAAYAMLGYAVVGPVFAGVLTNLPRTWWSSPAIGMAVPALVIGLVLPLGLLIILSLGLPPVGDRHVIVHPGQTDT
jgi:hypothetical protein